LSGVGVFIPACSTAAIIGYFNKYRGVLMRIAVACLLTVLTTACATQPKTAWIRSDGQRSTGDSVLTEQFELAGTDCANQRDKYILSLPAIMDYGLPGFRANAEREEAANELVKGCMAKKGYLLVPEEQAESKRQELLAMEVERKRQETAAAPTSARKPAPARR
jgi:hypothetical protein